MAEGGREYFYKPRGAGAIRPRPNVTLKKGAKFAMCNGTTCRGESCSFAHTPEEMRVWNSQLSSSFDESPPMPVQSSFVLNESDFPSIPSHSQHYFGQVGPAHSSSPWQPIPNYNIQHEVQHDEWPAVQYPVSAIGLNELEATFTGPVSGAFPPTTYTSNTYVSATPYHPGLDSYRTNPPRAAYSSDHPLPASGQPPSGLYGQGSGAYGFSSRRQTSGPFRQTSRTSVPLRLSNLQGNSAAIAQDDSSSLQESSTVPRKLDEPQAMQPAGPDPLYAKLSEKNYVSKFKRLVEVEKIAHEGILRERCNGDYNFLLLDSHCPVNVKSKNVDSYQHYAQIENISSDNLTYIRQTCTSVTLSTRSREEYKADIIDKFNRKLIIAFKRGAKMPTRRNMIKVIFNLKDSYFDDLSKSVNRLNPNLIDCIMPTANSFKGRLEFADVHMFESYCSAEQLEALKVMASCPSAGPPILLTGAFGTGKSRLLALAVHYFQTLQAHEQPVRVLVCTQQRISADKFLEYYDQVWVDVKKGECYLIREYALDEVKPNYRQFCKTSREFESIYRSSNCDNLVLITTCLTAPHLKFLPPGFFTHVIIDEGSMMREPEAIAALAVADVNTKVIVAGDANQVGPAMLVLGDLAKSNGMSVSLLQRLEKLYKSCGGTRNIATLSTNYRCHPHILDLVGNLFYEGRIKWNKDESPPATHRSFPFPLVFVCSSIDDDVSASSDKDENEAMAIYHKVMEVAKGCPSSWAKQPTSDFFVVSPTDEQVYLLRTKFRKSAIPPEIKTTNSIQGREYQAIFLSTSELVHEDGSSRNPVRSLCDPYVFTTAITRAKSLVISVGNPFLLLKMEQKMAQFYGQEHNAHCWSTYLNVCLERSTVEFAPNLKLTIEQQANAFAKMREMIEGMNDKIRTASESQEKDDLEKKVEQLEMELKALTMRKTPSRQSPALQARVHDLNQPIDINLPGTPFFPFAIDPNTGSTFPPNFSYQLYNNAVSVAAPDKTTEGGPQELPSYSTTQQDQHRHPSSYTGSHPVPVHFGVEDVEDAESPRICDTYSSEMAVNQDPLFTNYSDIGSAPPTEVGDSSWDEVKPYRRNGRQYTTSLDQNTETISGNGRFYTKENRLANEGFGVVYHVIEKATGNNYALKVIKLLANELIEQPEKLKEITALMKLNHDHTVHYEDVWIEEASKEWWGRRERTQYRNSKPCLFVLTELCETSTLKDWLIRHRGENSRNRKNMMVLFEQIVNGLVFIHQNGITHRDLKPSNIFFGRFAEEKLKIGDFGLSFLEQPSRSSTGAEVERQSLLNAWRKSPYRSPEQVELKATIDCKIDIYSLGIILFELHYPTEVSSQELAQVLSQVHNMRFPNFFKERMPKVHDAVLKMTKHSSKQRPSASEIQKHILTDLSTMNRKTRRSCVPVL